MHLRSRCSFLIVAAALAIPTVAKAGLSAWQTDVDKLSSKDAAERAQAADDLAKLANSRDAESIVAALLTPLKSGDAATRYETARLLAEFEKRAGAAVPVLVGLLKSDQDDLVRAAAARSLGYVAEPAGDTVAALADAIVDKDARVRRSAVRALVHLHPDPKISWPLYVKVLEDADPGLAATAIATAAELGDKIVPRAAAALAIPKARYWALLILEEVGPPAKIAVPEITKLLSDEQVEVRMHAALTLGAIGTDARDAVPDLIKALDDKERAVRFTAAYALGKIGAKEATAALEKQMSGDGPQFLKAVCAWALVESNPDNQQLADTAIKLLGDSLASKELRVRRGASRTLGEFKAAPEKAAPLLIAAMADPDPQVVENVSQALAKYGAKHVPEIAAALADKDRRECAVRTLGRIGPEAKAAVPQLTAAANDSVAGFRREALFALAGIGPAAAASLPTIESRLNDETPEVQYAAIYALGKIGPADKSAVPMLRKNLAGDDPFLKMASVWALLKIEGNDATLVKTALPILTGLLKDEHELRRIEAAHSLGEIGPAAAAALPLLKELAESDTAAVRKAAAEAIQKIGGSAK
jgi:HEAT repeat protein